VQIVVARTHRLVDAVVYHRSKVKRACRITEYWELAA
jgi:hypothetical protein